ncbi:MAG: septal ring lytic transglycosylase RlpA family protein [Bacillota bacterium]|nr:septal ring lytic transglycosylase RlpA family protein [Bacillota bacterium]
MKARLPSVAGASIAVLVLVLVLVPVLLVSAAWLGGGVRARETGVIVRVRESATVPGVWEVALGSHVVMRIRAQAGGMSAGERAGAVAQRLRESLADSGGEGVKPALVRGSFAVAAGDRLIVTVDSEHAAANRSSCYELALQWANNIRAALGVPVLRRVDGGHLVSLDGERRRSVHVGRASWYGGRWHGRPTATGEIYDQESLTAAHRTLPFGTVVRVTNLSNGKHVTVRINNRGPYVAGRDIDLSRAAAEAIDLIGPGVAPVAIEVVGKE